MKIVLMGYGKGLKLISEIAKRYFTISGIFTQDKEFYLQNHEYLENLRKYGLYEDITDYCRREKIDCFRSHSVTDSAALRWFKTKKLDLVICYSLWEKVKKEFLAEFKHTYNVHGSNIPNLMGRAPQSWAILNGFTTIGYTIHKMTSDIDQGPVVKACDVAVSSDDIPLTIIKRQEKALVRVADGFFKDFVSHKVKTIYPEVEKGNYWPGLKTDIDGEISWDVETFKIERMVRAFNKPFNGAWIHYRGDKLRFWEARNIKKPEFISCMTGVVFRKDKKEIFVTTRDGYIAIRTVSFKNRIYSAPELICLGFINKT